MRFSVFHRNPLRHFLLRQGLVVLALVGVDHAGSTEPAPVDDFCVASYRGFSSLASDSFGFFQRTIPESGMLKFTKQELETLFSFRSRGVKDVPPTQKVSATAAEGGMGRAYGGAASEQRSIGRERAIRGYSSNETVTVGSGAEQALISSILRRNVNIGESFTLKEIDEAVLLPAFKRLAYKHASDAKRKALDADIDDLVQASMIGLVEGIRTYPANSNIMFSTHAWRKMDVEVAKVLAQSSGGLTLADGGSQFLRSRIFLRTAYELKRELKRKPTAAEVAERYNKEHKAQVSSDLVLEAVERYKHARSTTSEISQEARSSEAIAGSNGPRVIDAVSLAGDEAPLLEVAYHLKQQQSTMAQLMLTKLTPKQLQILSGRYGVYPVKEGQSYRMIEVEGRTLEDMADDKMNRERIRQVEGVAIRTLKRAIFRDSKLTQLFSDRALFWGNHYYRHTTHPTERPLDF